MPAKVTFRPGPIADPNVKFLELPPPLPNHRVLAYPHEIVRASLLRKNIAPEIVRHKLWRLESDIYRKFCDETGIAYLPAPTSMIDANGMLIEAGWGSDATHANPPMESRRSRTRSIFIELTRSTHGSLHEAPLHRFARSCAMAACRRQWRCARSRSRVPFTIGAHDKVATSGSCFAQHIGRYLRESGLNYYVTETANPIAQPDIALKLGYGVFTARYGNIYTSRQLLQLLRRAFGRFTPKEDMWAESATKIIDPFRPNIQPEDFGSTREYWTDRESHLQHVREMFENLDVLVFTLGLTECCARARTARCFQCVPGCSAAPSTRGGTNF